MCLAETSATDYLWRGDLSPLGCAVAPKTFNRVLSEIIDKPDCDGFAAERG